VALEGSTENEQFIEPAIKHADQPAA